LLRENRFATQDVKDRVDAETDEVFLALMEALFREAVADSFHLHAPVRDAFRVFVLRHTAPLGLTIRELAEYSTMIDTPIREDFRSHVLGSIFVRQWIFENEPVQDFIAGLYRMNKAGRRSSRALSTQDHLRVLEAARNNLDCLFLRVRDSPRLFLLRE
jgi:hypothetical protein